MILTKLKTMIAILLLACVTAIGGSMFSRSTVTAAQAGDKAGTKPASPQAEDHASTKPANPQPSWPPKSIDETLLHGEWVGRVMGLNCSLIFGPTNKIRRILEGRDPGPNEAGTYSVDWKQKPYRLQVKWGSQPAAQTIIDFPAKNTLRIESGPRQDGVPQAFTSSATVLTKREKAQPGSKQAEKDADRDLASAEFYHRGRKFGSAYFYYELVRLRYPDSIQANRAQEGLQSLQEHRIRRADGTEGWETDPAQQPGLTPPLPPQVPPDISITAQELQQLKQQAKALEARIRALETSGRVQPGTRTGSYAPTPPPAVEAIRQQIRDLDSRLRLLESRSKANPY